MVFGDQGTLHLEQVFWVAQVVAQFVRNFALGFHRSGEHTFPGFEHWVLLVKLIKFHRAVVGVHHGFHGVTDVSHLLGEHLLRGSGGVDGILSGFGEGSALGVRQVLQRGVAVHDPLNAAVDHGGIGGGIRGQPRCHLFHAGARIAVENNLRTITDAIREQQFHFLVLQRKRRTVDRIGDIHTTVTVVGEVGGVRIVLKGVLATGLTDDRIIQVFRHVCDNRTKVHTRLGDVNAQLIGGFRIRAAGVALDGL